MYTSLPPGLQRRIAYGEYIRSRTQRQHYNIFRDWRDSYFEDYSNTYSNTNQYDNQIINNVVDDITTNYINRVNHIIDEIDRNTLNNTIEQDFFRDTYNISRGLTLKEFTSVSILNATKQTFFCPICHSESADENTIYTTLICNHKFHIDCIKIWLSDNTTCPICRLNLSCD